MSVQLAPSRRARKKQATREALHEAAFILAEERGLAGTTIEAITDRADVAPRTFFNYFTCKEDAILDRDPERVERFRQELLARPAHEDALTALRGVVESEFARRLDDVDRSLRRTRLIRSDPQLMAAMAGYSDEIERALVAAVAERTGQDPDDLYPSLVVTAAWGALKAAHLYWSERGGQVPHERVLGEAFDTLARGLTPPPRARRRTTPSPRKADSMTIAPEAPAAPSTAYSHREIMLIMSGLMFGLLLASLDQTIVSTALTTIAKDFGRLDLYSWVVTAYLLTSTASTPLYGKISDLFGRKTIFQISIVIFLIGSALSGLSQSMIQLIIFRGVQGIGAGGLMTLALAIVGDVIPPRDRGRYQGYFGAVFGVSSVLGPLIGGFLVDQASWRWVFYVNIPIGIVALVVINRVLKLDHRPRKSSIDIAGSVLIVGGVSLLLVAVQDVGTAAKLTTAATIFGVVGIVLIGAFVWWETRAAEPIIPLRLFRNRVFSVSNALGFITGIVMFGALVFLPQYFQRVRGISPTLSGLRLLPMLAGLLITSIGSGRLISKLGRYKVFVIAGTALVAVGLAWMTTIHFNTSSWVLAAMLFVIGAGLGLFMQTLILAVQNSIGMEDMGTGTASVTFFRTLGGAIGAAVLGAILIAQEKTNAVHDIQKYGQVRGPLEAFTNGMDRAFLYAVPVAILAFLLSFMLKEIRLHGGGRPAALEGESLLDE